MSTDKQEDSIPRQQSVMRPRAQLEGLEVVKEFADAAISGGSTAGRDGFALMLDFCKKAKGQKRPIQAIVCYDTSRFSRATSMETGAAIWELQKVGVHQVVTAERRYDFRREEDRAIFLLTQDFTNHKYLKDHAKRVREGKGRAHEAGWFVGGSTPYAFDRLLVDKAGEPVQLFRRGEAIPFKRAGQHVLLVPIPDDDADPDRALQPQTVRWLFEAFDRDETSYLALARTLTARKVPGPGSGMLRRKAKDDRPEVRKAEQVPWDWQAVKLILTSPLYRGIYRLGALPDGKYFRVVNGEPVIDSEKGTAREKNPAPAEVKLKGKPMVEPALWQRVQEKIVGRGKTGARPRQSRHTYVLAGILHCGHCKRSMHGHTPRCRKKGRKAGYYSYTRYVCTSADKTGGLACRYYGVREGAILPRLVERIQARYTGSRLEGLRRRIIERVESLHQPDSRELERLRGRAAGLDAEIVQGRKNLLRVQGGVFDELNVELGQWLLERKRLQGEIGRLEGLREQPATLNLEKVRQALDGLQDLAGRLAEGDVPAVELARVLRLFVHQIRVHFGQPSGKKGGWFRLERVEVDWRPVLEEVEFIGNESAECKRRRDRSSP